MSELDDPFAQFAAAPADAPPPAPAGADGLDDPFRQFVIRRPDGAAGSDPNVDPKTAGQAPPIGSATPTSGAKASLLPDLLKSLGIGAVQGGLGLAGLPGTIETLARMGIDRASTGLGFQNPNLEASHSPIPDASTLQSGIESYTGPFYQPQTTAGKYARTIGEFLPSALFPAGGIAGRATNVLAPAVASETGGELTEGTKYEPWARMFGGLLGGVLPQALMRTITPAAPAVTDAVRDAHLQNLENNGVTALSAGQRTGNARLRQIEDAANGMYFSGSRIENLQNQASDQFTRAALAHAGIAAERATPDVINQGYQNLGQQFDTLAQRNAMNVDQPLKIQAQSALDDYRQAVPNAMQAPIVSKLNDDIQAAQGTMTGAQYQSWRSQIERVRRNAAGSDPHLADALGEMRDSLDDAMSRSASPQDQAAWQHARGQYRNLLVLDKAARGAGEASANGVISPAKLQSAARSIYKGRQRSDLENLGSSGVAVMNPLKSSGTAERSLAQKVLALGTLPELTFLMTQNPTAAAGTLAASMSPSLVSRAIMSRPMQAWMSNRTMVPAMRSYAASQAPSAYRFPQAATDLASPPEQRGIRGGMGPRYDAHGNLLPGQGAFQ